MDILSTYPAWFGVLCVLLAALYSFLLYRFDPKTREFPLWTRRLLSSFRFLLILFLSFLLLQPLIRTQESEVEEPVIAVLQDVSASVPLGGDSAFFASEYPERMEALRQELGQEFELRPFSFGKELMDSIVEGYPAEQTDISRALESVRERFRDRNLGGVLLATDGIYNTGVDPRYYADRLGVPLHMLALGDTTVRKDLIVKEVAHNRYAYQGNRFPIEAVVQGRRAEGSSSVLTVQHQGRELHSEELNFESEEETKVRRIRLDADSVGMQRYTVSVEPIEGEVSEKNNRKEVFIEVLDSKRQVRILAHAPHPDIRAMKWGIESKNSYEVETVLAKEFDEELDELDLLILHQLPSSEFGVKEILERCRERGMSVLFVLGSATSYAGIDAEVPGLSIEGREGKSDQAKALFNKDFQHFDAEAFGRKAEEWPPLDVPFGEWEVGKGVEALFHKKMGRVETEKPLWGFMKRGEQKFGFIGGEGLWRWRLANMAEDGENEAFERILEKTVQYLSVEEDKSRFRVEGEKAYKENERIRFRAELYDRSYELMNEPEVSMRIEDEEGKSYNYSFSRTSQAYRLDAGSLPVGRYHYRAVVEQEGDSLSEEGVFRVTPVQVERSRTVADHGLLYDLSRRTNGSMFYPEEMEAIPDTLRNSAAAKPVTYTQERLTDLISWKWLFIPLLLLVTLEWGLRKRMGAY